MVDEILLDEDAPDAPRRKRKRRWAKRLGWALLILIAPFVVIGGFLSTPIGKRWVTDQIAAVAPASGLRFEVGRIEGDIYGRSVLHDVVLMDPKGVFATVPEVALDWRPLNFLWSGIDVRRLELRRGRLERLPELNPGDPDAPLLPDFDIRVDRLVIEDMVIAPGVAGDRAHTASLQAQVDIRRGRALIDAKGRIGRDDRLALLLDARPDRDQFDLSLDYRAAADGPIAQMAGLDASYTARIEGDGTWQRWLGHALVTRQKGDAAPERVAALRLTNQAGTYSAVGRISPSLDQSSMLGRAVGRGASVVASGTLEESVFDGDLAVVTPAINFRGDGTIDLAGNSFDGFDIRAGLRDPSLLGEDLRLEETRLVATLDGRFRDLAIDHRLVVGALVSGDTRIEGLRQAATARIGDGRVVLPLDAEIARVATGLDLADARLIDGSMTGELVLTGNRLASDPVQISFPGLDARLTLRGNIAEGAYAIAGPIEARGLELESVGTASANAKVLVKFGSDIPWNVRANVTGRLTEVSNSTIANLAGPDIRFSGAFGMGADQPIVLRDVDLSSERLTARLDSRIVGDRTTLAGRGNHTQYGDFTIDAEITGDGPRATLVLADPYPAAGLKDVRLTLAPAGDGFAIDAAGDSMLGPFEGVLGLVMPAEGPTRIDIDRLQVYRTDVSGRLVLEESGISGNLRLAGGGLDGMIALEPGADGAQGFDVNLTAKQARFGGDTPIGLAYADIDARGSFAGDTSRIVVAARGSGLEYGSLSVARFAANAEIVDGRGEVTASIAGRRSDRFSLKFDGDIAPERIALLARGEYGGRAITMPRRAVLTARDGGGWTLAPTQIGFANGFAVLEGTIGGEDTRLEAKLSQMPLRLADLAGSELGLGGRLSGIIAWNQPADGVPNANARVRIDDFTRSGLVLTSTPIDLLAVADLSADRLELGALLRDEGKRLGRLDATISDLGGGEDLARRIMRGRLAARFAYDGSATALWRLAAIETFDLTGPVTLTARARGTLADPQINGSLAGDSMRLQSAISGTDIQNVSARGRFVGSRLELTRFAGTTRGDGQVSGSGIVDLANMGGGRGPRIDIRVAARDARLLNANGLDATLTGPLRIVSNGVGGTIAGRVSVDRASWRLGTADEDMSLPQIAVREINRPDTTAVARRDGGGAWRYLVNARAPSRVAVDGMGLDSEWGIDIALRGTVDDPRIGGTAQLVRGDYTFAGTRFELTRGRIRFDANVPIDPRLDITAEASASGTDVTVRITGNAQTPQIAFSSEPPLPEEEILARLLFGGSVTSLSATDALQLGAAVASLRGGSGGLDPIGDLRRSIGLDQLRIVSADPALGRGTGVALGKNIGQKFYVEIVTDGRGYSATSVEYRVTSWLALLATVSTIGRDSVLAEISRDY